MEAVLFFLAAIGAIGGAIGVVALRNPFYSGAGADRPPVLAGGALPAADLGLRRRRPGGRLRRRGDGPLRLRRRLRRRAATSRRWEPVPGQRFLAGLLVGFVLFVELSAAVLSSALKALGTHGPDVPAGFGDPAAIGTLLLEKFLVPFEASSILLLIAAVGAIVLAAQARTARRPSSDGRSVCPPDTQRRRRVRRGTGGPEPPGSPR